MKSQLLAIRSGLERFPLSVLQLAMRLGIAATFFRSGLLKINSWEFAVLLFRDEYRLPYIDPTLAARLATTLELGVPVFLALGLGTRLATLPLLGMIAVIQVLVYPNAWSDHLMWASILLVLLTRGAGTLSVDHLIARRHRRSVQRPHHSGGIEP